MNSLNFSTADHWSRRLILTTTTRVYQRSTVDKGSQGSHASWKVPEKSWI